MVQVREHSICTGERTVIIKYFHLISRYDGNTQSFEHMCDKYK